MGKGIYKPTSIGIGTNIDVSTPDPGVATFVGRDMYIGGKPSNPSILGAENAPTGSYAVEAEGLTVVRGKLAMNPLKESWPYNGSGAGFRFGTVGFGSQFRPVVGSTVLAVAGINSEITNMSVGYNGDSPSTTTVGAWNKGAWVGQQKSSEGATPSGFAYTAQIAGPITYWKDNDRRQSVVTTQGNWHEGETPKDSNLFNKNAGLTDVNGKNYTNFLESEVKAKISTPLAKLAATGSYTVDVAKTADNYTIKKYNNSDNRPTYGLKFDNSTKTFTRKTNYTDVNGNNASAQVKLVNNEKLITFTGNANESGNGSPLQVFNLKASDLTNSIGDTTYRGVDFSFENIPEGASVVVNIVDEKGHSATPVEFNTGWRFWWNGKEISRGYEEDGDGNTRSLYSTAAQSIMWNFATAKQVTIRGGMALEGNKELNSNADGKWTDDDPAAAMLGSIVVPNGSFEDHVTTNGRVYVGEDFQMYNPTVAGKFTEGDSASVIDMDQERHNFPWSGSYTPDGSSIAWSKVDAADRTTPLAGSEWAIYASENDAKNKQNSIVSIVDNGMNDFDPTVGTIQFNYLNQKANIGNPDNKDYFTYYIRETKAPEGYELSNEIYTSKMFHTGDELNLVGNVDTSGNENSKPQSAIPNAKITGTVSWTKVAEDDSSKTPLKGSEWKLAKLGADDSTEEKSWTVSDRVSDQSTSSDTTWADTDTAPGKFTLEGLQPGTYTLVETQAPFGYEKNPKDYKFTVSSTDGSITWTEDKKPTFDEGGNAYISDSLTTTSVTVPVTKSVRNTDWPKDSSGKYVAFKFSIAATGENKGNAPKPEPTTISVVPSGSTKLNDATATFGAMTFNKSHLSDTHGKAGDYAKTYTYTVKEVAPTSDAIDKLRYSKAEYQIAVTVKAVMGETTGKYTGLTTSTTVTQVKDDMGNTVNKVIGTVDAPKDIPASTFTNVKVLTDLPLTGAGWTENSMLLVGAGLMLLGGIAAGAYWFATKRHQDDSSDGAGR
ncbi:SpaA isopeptide-forming pilin-related protein [Collinsella sp. TF05-9AC]|uniref:SpaA isopeptide-forming pilin-related protein n=1 Tax=Collinsella sp. TF05-9AC TaxID=2292330 RepID=UPI000E43C7F2|nr:SpaA isopeptide-forming pilin-related protein [Collinsella sp. TF05-9AC]RGL72719.1 hypothetical protein DXC52_00765 [Collinsella sp. TF05-9AC]